MTELEKHLLKALKKSEDQYNQQHNDLQKAQKALLSMFKTTQEAYEKTQKENLALKEQVQELEKSIMKLKEPMTKLMIQAKQLEGLYMQSRK